MSGTKILNPTMPNADDIRTAQIQALLAEDAYLQLDETTKTWRHLKTIPSVLVRNCWNRCNINEQVYQNSANN